MKTLTEIEVPEKQCESKSNSLKKSIKSLIDFLPTSGAVNEIAAVDGLRALAIIGVFATHVRFLASVANVNTGPNFLVKIVTIGFSGVFLFFCLTGFLLFLPYARAILSDKPLPSVKKFYIRRALRILPLFYTALIILLLFQNQDLLVTINKKTYLFLFTLFYDMSLHSMNVISLTDSPFWTLAIEWQYYLILPLLAYALTSFMRLGKNKKSVYRFIVFIVLLVISCLAVRWSISNLYYFGHSEPLQTQGWMKLIISFIYGANGKYIEIFALGIAASFLYVACVEKKMLSVKKQRIIGSLAGISFIIGIIVCFLWYNHDSIGNHWAINERWEIMGEWSLGVCYTMLIIATLMGPVFIRKIFSFAPLRFIGIISYSIYVWHFPIVISLTQVAVHNHPNTGYIRLLVISAIVTIIFSTGSYYLIERPFIKYRRAAR